MFCSNQTTLRFFALAHLKKNISKQDIWNETDFNYEGYRNLTTSSKIKELGSIVVVITLNVTIESVVTLKEKTDLFYVVLQCEMRRIRL